MPEIGEKELIGVTRRILDTVRKPLSVDSHTLKISTSGGVVIFPRDGEDDNQLIKNADIAMYEAKKRGRDNFQYYNHKDKL